MEQDLYMGEKNLLVDWARNQWRKGSKIFRLKNESNTLQLTRDTREKTVRSWFMLVMLFFTVHISVPIVCESNFIPVMDIEVVQPDNRRCVILYNSLIEQIEVRTP